MSECSDRGGSNRKIKCVVWDLDNTLWDGVLLENDRLVLREGVAEIIATLDRRGILQSLSSRNEHDRALAQLAAFGLDDYFLYPQINWNPKSQSLTTIARELNIGIDTLAFVDDQEVEREEVRFSLPSVLTIAAADLDRLLDLPEMNPRFITEDSSRRRVMYRQDMARRKLETDFVGPKDAFLATLQMVLTIAPAQEADLERAEELTLRTNQLNTTGYTYSYEELSEFCRSDRHSLLVAELEDKYGSYGKIGLTLLERRAQVWIIKLLLMSCRVMSRGVGAVMINYLRREAKQQGVRLCAELLPNDRNRMMYMTLKFAHFSEAERIGDLVVLESDLAQAHTLPSYLVVKAVRPQW